MSEKLKVHLAALGEKALAPLLGSDVVELLRHVGSDAMAPQVMAKMIITSRGAGPLLADPVVRGLLLAHLSDEDVRNICALLGIESDAPRVTIEGVPFEMPNQGRVLYEWFNVSYEQSSASDDNLSRNVESREKLWPHQHPAYRKLRSLLAQPNNATLVHMPFGAGKMRIVTTAILEAFRAEADDGSILWLAPDACLSEEAMRELEGVWHQLGIRDVIAYRLFGDRRIEPLDSIGNALIVADLTQLLLAVKEWEGRGIKADDALLRFGERLRTIVLSDAEQAMLPEVEELLKKLGAGSTCNLIGISAAPNLAMQAVIDVAKFKSRFNGNIVELDDPEPLQVLRDRGETDPIDVYALQSPIVSLDLAGIGTSLSDAVAEELASNVERNRMLLDKLHALAKDQQHRIVFYAATAKQARMFAGLLDLKGTASSAVTSDMPYVRQRQELALFTSTGVKQVACVHGLLVSAQELHGVTALVIGLPTVSGALLHEMVGRLSTRRGDPDHPLQIHAVMDPVPSYLRLIENLGAWDKLQA